MNPTPGYNIIILPEIMNKTKLIIDTDPGVDDALAFLIALVYPSLEIKLASSVYGNNKVDVTTENIFKIIHLYQKFCQVNGSKFPVVKGNGKPLKRKYSPFYEIHGKDGLGDSGLPGIKRPPVIQTKVEDAIADIVYKDKNNISILCLGPLTNIANFVLKYPKYCRLVKEIVIMGGAFDYPGNTNLSVEANFGWDPDALKIVMDSGFRQIIIIPLNVTQIFQIGYDDFKNIKNLEVRKIFLKIFTNYLSYYLNKKKEFLDPVTSEVVKFSGASVHDVLALYLLSKREKAKTRKINLGIIDKGKNAGKVFVDEKRSRNNRKNINITYEMDYSGIKKFIFENLNKYDR